MKVLIEFITEIRKKEKIKHILGMGSSSTENYENNDFNSFYKRMTCMHKHTTSIVLHQSDKKRCI